MTKLITAAGTAGAVVATAVTGSIASRDVRSRWYRRLDKPPIQPPGAVFGPVWTALYADLAVTAILAQDRLRRDPAGTAAYRTALTANLVLNASWSWVFFRFHQLLPAAAVAGALAVSSIDLARRTYRAHPSAGIAQAPYPAWCSFATVLSTAIWVRNR